jgi:hypothetical protein
MMLRAMAKVFQFSTLPTADLVIDAVYEGGTKGSTADIFVGDLMSGRENLEGLVALTVEENTDGGKG